MKEALKVYMASIPIMPRAAISVADFQSDGRVNCSPREAIPATMIEAKAKAPIHVVKTRKWIFLNRWRERTPEPAHPKAPARAARTACNVVALPVV